MSHTPASAAPARALLLLDAQRYHHEKLEEMDVRAAELRLSPWRTAVAQARAGGVLVVFLQQDGEAGGEWEPLTRGWTLHPDFRVEDGDLLLRTTSADAFAGSHLELELRSRGIAEISLLALPESAAAEATRQAAQQRGFAVGEWQEVTV